MSAPRNVFLFGDVTPPVSGSGPVVDGRGDSAFGAMSEKRDGVRVGVVDAVVSSAPDLSSLADADLSGLVPSCGCVASVELVVLLVEEALRLREALSESDAAADFLCERLFPDGGS